MEIIYTVLFLQLFWKDKSISEADDLEGKERLPAGIRIRMHRRWQVLASTQGFVVNSCMSLDTLLNF